MREHQGRVLLSMPKSSRISCIRNLLVMAVVTTAAAAMGAASAASDNAHLPVVDVSGWIQDLKANLEDANAHDAIVAHLDDAFSRFGFAVVVGHGVDTSKWDEVYLAAKEFFHGGTSSKHQYNLNLGYGYGGYLPAGSEAGGQLTGNKNPDGDLVESLTCRGLHHLTSGNNSLHTSTERHFAQDMSDTPFADRMPTELIEPVLALHGALMPMKTLLLRLTEKVMGVEAGAFQNTFDPRRGGIRFPFYPELETFRSDEKLIGYGAHADSGGMVLLRVDRNNPIGTEVLHRGQWLPVPVLPNAIVLNGGTVLQRLTGGRWKAAVHRAARANRRERLSIVYGAMVPDNDVEVSSLAVADLADAERKKGSVVRVKEYLDARVRLQRPEVDPRDRKLIAYVDEQ